MMEEEEAVGTNGSVVPSQREAPPALLPAGGDTQPGRQRVSLGQLGYTSLHTY